MVASDRSLRRCLGIVSALVCWAELNDCVDRFQNVHLIDNQSNNTMGTTTLLDPEWAITVRHFVQNGGMLACIAAILCWTCRRQGALP